MTPEQFKQLSEMIKNENGRFNAKLDAYIEEDKAWKEEVVPIIEQMKKIMDFATIGSAILKTVVLIGAGTAAIAGFISYLRN